MRAVREVTTFFFTYIIMISEYYIVRPLKPQYRRCDNERNLCNCGVKDQSRLEQNTAVLSTREVMNF